MPEEIKKHLEKFGDELAAVDREATDELREAVDAYERDGDRRALIDRLRKSAVRFESSHPEAAGVIARVIDSLSAAGI